MTVGATTMRLALILCLCAPAARAGLVMRYESDHKLETVFIDGNKMRMEEPDKVLIFDGDAKQLIALKPAKKTYGLSTERDLREAGAKFRAEMEKASDQMKEQMGKLTPEQRKQMEEALAKMDGSGESKPAKEPARKRAKPEVSWKPLGETRTVAGFSCQMYAKQKGGETEEKECLIPWSAGAVKKADLEVMRKFGDFFGEAYAGMGVDLKEAGKQMMGEFIDAPGFPALVQKEDGEIEGELKGLERTSISSDKFRVPAGYTKTGLAVLEGDRE